MITDRIKAEAIALLKLGETPEEVSEELEIPYMLVKEWYGGLGFKDITELKANTNALEKIIKEELLPSSEENTELLRLRIEETALKIVNRVNDEVKYADLPTSKALQLLANTCSILYNTVINKGQANNNTPPGVAALSMFDQIAKD